MRPPEHDHPHERVGDRHPARTFVDSYRFWAGVAFVILSGLFIFSVVTYSRESSDRAARRASVTAEYEQCLAAIPTYRSVSAFIAGVKSVGAVLLLNSIQMHEITPPGSTVYKQQAKNIRRLRQALSEQAGVTIPAPTTAADCRAQRDHHG